MAPLHATSLRDRMSEFQAIAERLQKQQGSSAGPSQSSVSSISNSKNAAQSDFARVASQIGLGIHKTSVKLQKLAQLAKRTSMFDDPSAEIDELTGVIKHEIQQLNNAIAELQRLSGKAKDENKQSLDHSHTVVDNLRSRLKDTTQEFKEVLTLRTENLKVHQHRRQLFSNTPDASVTTPLLTRQGSVKTASNLFGGQGGNTTGQQQQQLMLQAPQQDGYLSSRAEALHNVEATIVELGSIFTQLAEMVAQQGEMAQRIDENVDDTLRHVDDAKAQLLRYLNNISSNRWLILKVFGVLVVFLMLFIVFIL